MSEPIISWLNDDSEYQRCYVCGQRNADGLRVVYHNEGPRIVTEFTAGERFQSFPGVVHGGILAALLDETMGRVSLIARVWTMTARLELRYRAPVPVNTPLRIVAEPLEKRRSIWRVRGWVTAVSDPATILCEADGAFMPLPAGVRAQATQDWPGLERFFDPQ